ncbi:hypothetical protein ABEY43_05995 [Priestia megaterium]
MKINQLSKDEIMVIDPLGGTGNKCNCGKDAMFILGIHGHYINLCETCMGKVGKTVIDGLV